MSRRERLESKLARRAEWASKADARSNARHAAVRTIADAIPFGQPILVGHHSEGHARRDAERIRNGMDRAVEESKLAEHHRAKAGGLASQLERSVFSDDENAIAQLEARITEREAECVHMKAINAAYKKTAPGDDVAVRLATLVALGQLTREQMMKCAQAIRFGGNAPYPSYATTNLRSSIRRDRERIEEIKARAARAATAQQAGGVVIEALGTVEAGQSYTRVTFAEKPAGEVLEVLRAAGFNWSRGSWVGETARLPDCVKSTV